MQTDFVQFGTLHLAIIAFVPAFAYALARGPLWSRYPLAAVLIVNEIIWRIYEVRYQGWHFPEGLPIQLCDLTLWLTVISLLTLNQWTFEAAYFLGVAGAGMAIIQPDLWAPMASYPTIQFFVGHCGIVSAVLFLIWGQHRQPSPGCLKRVLIMLNCYAALVGTFNAIFHANYMYLCRKPQVASLLDLFGPWPIYVFVGEAVAMLLFFLLYLPFRGKATAISSAPESPYGNRAPDSDQYQS